MSVRMFVCLYVCLSACLCVCLYVYMFVCMSMCLSVCLYVCLYVYVFVCMSVCLSVCLYVCLYVYMFVCMSICLSVCLYVVPISNHTVLKGAQRHVTRFISLANAGNPDKKNRVTICVTRERLCTYCTFNLVTIASLLPPSLPLSLLPPSLPPSSPTVSLCLLHHPHVSDGAEGASPTASISNQQSLLNFSQRQGESISLIMVYIYSKMLDSFPGLPLPHASFSTPL